MGLRVPTDTARRWITDPVESGSAAGFGVYLHVPFCHHRCGYCDFATEAVGGTSSAERRELFGRYVAAVRADLARQVAAGRRAHAPPGDDLDDAWPAVTSVFVGGGTPTLLPPDLIAELLRGVTEELDVAGDVELTVECNPETASDDLMSALADVGVTRLSMGAQSFADHVLAVLERRHTPGAATEAVALARAAGISSVSLDVIYGTPGESDADWEATLAATTAAGVDHVSAYALTVHANTPFGRQVADGALPAPDDDVQRTRFDTARRHLAAAGFEQYEVANFSRGPARRSRHNTLYWRHGDYLGCGVGAHGHLAGRRWWSTRSTPRYLEAVESGRHLGPGPSPAVTGDEVLDDGARAVERLMLGLRLAEGLHPNDTPPVSPLGLEDALGAGLVETACGRLRCTTQGWFLLDDAVSRLLV